MDKIVPILMLLVAFFIVPARAGWFEDAQQILGDMGEIVVRAFNLPLSATKGRHNCGDEVQYKDSELNPWNFRGWHPYYPCCHGYERYQEYDVDCDKPVCDEWKACGDRGSCVEPGRCRCHTGYTGEDYGCQDYTCTGTHDCGRRGTCIGPNLCKCQDGYRGSEEGCKRDIDECVTGPCDQSCTNTVGSFKCSCYPGFEMKDGRCVNIDECENNPCDQICTDTPGSYTCSCNDGFEMKNDKCINIDECENTPCDQICADTPGSYTCSCNDGFDMKNDKCININECENNPCDQICTDSPGSYYCSCNDDFEMKDGKCLKQHVDDDSLPEDIFPGFKPNIPSHNPKPALATWTICLIVGGILFCILLGMCFCYCRSRSNQYHNV